MTQMRMRRVLGVGMLTAFAASAQAPPPIPKGAVPVHRDSRATGRATHQATALQPAGTLSTRSERRLGLDPSLLSNQSYLAPYPALLSFLSAHPEVARNPSFYIGEGSGPFASAQRPQGGGHELVEGFAEWPGHIRWSRHGDRRCWSG